VNIYELYAVLMKFLSIVIVALNYFIECKPSTKFVQKKELAGNEIPEKCYIHKHKKNA